MPGAAFVNAAEGGALKMDCCNAVAVTSPAAAAGLWNVPSSFAMVSDLDFAYCICCSMLVLTLPQYYLQDQRSTYNFPSKEVKSLQLPHSLARRLNISKHHMRLAAHLHSLQSDDIENWTVCAEEDVEGVTEVFLLDLGRW